MTKLTITSARANLPAKVASRLIDLAKQHHTRKLSLQMRESVYLDEDQRYAALVNGEWISVRVGGEWHGAENMGLIAKDMKLPVGAWVIETQLFLGKWFLTVYHNNGQPWLPGAH